MRGITVFGHLSYLTCNFFNKKKNFFFFYFIVLGFGPVLTYNLISVLQNKDAWSNILLLNVFKIRVKQTCNFTMCLFMLIQLK